MRSRRPGASSRKSGLSSRRPRREFQTAACEFQTDRRELQTARLGLQTARPEVQTARRGRISDGRLGALPCLRELILARLELTNGCLERTPSYYSFTWVGGSAPHINIHFQSSVEFLSRCCKNPFRNRRYIFQFKKHAYIWSVINFNRPP